MLLSLILLFTCIPAYASTSFTCSKNTTYLRVELPTKWTSGSINCFHPRAREPDVDVFAVNNDTFILRENKCINYEAPFMYLLFGTKNVLLIDSGATVSSTSFPIRQHVEAIVNHWCNNKKKHREDLELVVAHTHNHLDHIAGDRQFQGQYFTTVVGATVANVSYFFKLSKWPSSIGTFALDDQRQLAIIPIPGHENASIAFYDCATGLLFTGDSLLPGRLYISNFSANVDSTQRLLYFIESNNLNVSAILGAHIEMTQTDKVDYPIGATYQPKERLLNLSLDHLHQLNAELQEQWKAGFNQRHKAYYDAFIVDPNPSQLPPFSFNGRTAEHGFILLPLSTLGLVWISHKPMFRTPHDFQLVFMARVTHPNVNSLLLPTNTSILQNQWTILPDLWSLNNLLNGNMTIFSARFFRGNFEQNGQYIKFIVDFYHELMQQQSQSVTMDQDRDCPQLVGNKLEHEVHVGILPSNYCALTCFHHQILLNE
ncbi:unnamed protein product [Rotaria sp. Silwood2]|nr:unnamed protein product [Rotaria sp. Silwood2]CAF2520737.1 unnamed protein product [Rotaria sp. Silwood2]CAF3854821.1 unnamed protein product [Rotaria sp. Silwood2]CAF3897150.1 unnamed protein product [Rotaria sp. Silwood2]